MFKVPVVNPCLSPVAGLLPCKNWRVYGLHDMPGFFFILNPFLPGYQRYWTYRCLHDYPVKPHVTNMDNQVSLTAKDNIWDITGGQRSKNNLLDKLRWVTLGYHYDWTNKVYYKDKFTTFPDDLYCLSKYITAVLGFPQYTAEAAIINYYHLDSTLSGHTDHSEFDHEAPLLSVSFGQPCIFLVGGTSKDIEPKAMYLHSGDIVIMSGACRLAYHAVPKIISTNMLPDCFNISLDTKNVSNPGTDQLDSKGDTSELFSCAKENPSPVGDGYKIADADSDFHQKESHVNKDIDDFLVETIGCECLHHKKENLCDYKTIDSVNKCIELTMQTVKWDAFGDFLIHNRVNMNVRQVFYPGNCWSQDDCQTQNNIVNKSIEIDSSDGLPVEKKAKHS